MFDNQTVDFPPGSDSLLADELENKLAEAEVSSVRCNSPKVGSGCSGTNGGEMMKGIVFYDVITHCIYAFRVFINSAFVIPCLQNCNILLLFPLGYIILASKSNVLLFDGISL